MMNAIFPMEVLETPGQVTIIQESYNQVRHIYLGEQMPKLEEYPSPALRLFGGPLGGQDPGGGHRRGEGGGPLPPGRRTAGAPLAGDEDQRADPAGGARLPAGRVTITDPKYLAAPWRFTYLYKRSPGYKIQEYVCEDNRAYVDAEGHTHVDFGGARK